MSIVLEHVTKRYGRKVAVDDLSLRVEPGEVFAFLGPNGAGKTTTIKLMVGLLQPDSGSVQVCGHSMNGDGREAKAQLAYVPDTPYVYDKLSGAEFLEFVAHMYGVPREEAAQRTAHYIDALRIDEFVNQLAEGYSHGMKQRLALAAALLHEPRVLIVDEPMVGLDPRMVRIVKNLFRARADAGLTVFMSTHTLEIAEALADRIGIINNGRLVAEGTLAELRGKAAREHSLEDIFMQLTEEAALDAPAGRDAAGAQSP